MTPAATPVRITARGVRWRGSIGMASRRTPFYDRKNKKGAVSKDRARNRRVGRNCLSSNSTAMKSTAVEATATEPHPRSS